MSRSAPRADLALARTAGLGQRLGLFWLSQRLRLSGAGAGAWRCPWAVVRHGDMWSVPWVGHILGYLFQRPESRQRVAAKARAELRPCAWLVSLEFEAPALVPRARLAVPEGRPVWLYRAPLQASV